MEPVTITKQTIKKKAKKKNRSAFYRISAWLHLWLGLFTGIVVVVVSLTGAILVFEQELRVLTQPYQTVESHNKAYLPPSQLREVVIKKYHLPAVSAVVYQGRDRSAVVPYYGDRKRFQLIYVDPYTAQVLHFQLLEKDFFRIMLELHYNLLLPREVGSPIVAYSTLIFVITLLTGLVLWYPKKWNSSTRKQCFKIKWNGKVKRINYDLHNVLGFYSLLIGLILGLSGMVFGLKWFSNAVYKTASGGIESKFDRLSSDSTLVKAGSVPDEDILFGHMLEKYQNIDNQLLTIGYPRDKAGTWTVSLATEAGRRLEEHSETYEQVSLKKLSKAGPEGKERADNVMRLNYDLHVGSVGGLTTKIIAVIVCIISASLPITGFIIWWGKR